MSKWRLIIDGDCSASFNMAADKYLFEYAEKDPSFPVLRIYGWEEPSITIGHHQSVERAIDKFHLGDTPVVKRITGGRALLHEIDEITYAIAGDFLKYPQLGNSLNESYNHISNAIVNFYESLGWKAEINRRDNSVSLNKSNTIQKGCMAAVSHYEVLINNRKMAVGSQRRGVHSFLQHGAIKLFVPQSHPAILGVVEGVGPKEVEGGRLDRNDIIGDLIMKFECEFGIEFEKNNWDLGERKYITEIESDFDNLNPTQIDLNKQVS
jgi:lipoate-protein ligase A